MYKFHADNQNLKHNMAILNIQPVKWYTLFCPLFWPETRTWGAETRT